MRKKHEIIVILFSCGLQVLAVFQLRGSPELTALPPEWFPQFLFLTYVSILLTLGFFLLHNDRQKITLIFLNTIVLILKSYPTGQLLTMDIVLLTSILLPALLFLVQSRGIFISLIILGSFMAFQGGDQVWETEKAALSHLNFFFLLTFGLSLIILLQIIRYQSEKNKNLIKRNVQLSSAIEELTRANISFQEYAAGISEQSKMLERKRIAHDIHDSIGYNMMNIKMMMDACLTMTRDDWDELIETLMHTRAQALTGLQDARGSLRSLAEIEMNSDFGLRALKKLTIAFSNSTGVEVALNYGSIPWRFDPEIDYILYHMVQEGMTNSLCHGSADKISITIGMDPNRVNISIGDNGSGASEIEKGLGITGMIERIERKGGSFLARNTSTGFEISASIPLSGTGS